MITLTKKLLAVLTLVMLVAVCMAIPAMAADLTWDLSVDASTVIEAEWYHYGYTENPDTIPEADLSTQKKWLEDSDASNGYLYNINWEVDDTERVIYVNAPVARNYDVELLFSDKDNMSEASVYVGPALAIDTHTDEGELMFRAVDKESVTPIKKYVGESIPFAQGLNQVIIITTKRYSTNTYSNAYMMDCIKFTPASEELPLAVIGVEDNTVNANQLSVVFNKPITSVEDIAVDAQHGTATIAVDADSANRVKITDVAGRTTITVPKGFTGGTDFGIAETYEKTVFAYPVTLFAKNSYANNWNADKREVKADYEAEAGMWTEQSSSRKIRGVIALYDGDRMVAYSSKNFNLPTSSFITVTLPEGEKFTEVKVFGFLEIDGELIPIDTATTRTAAQLGATFE